MTTTASTSSRMTSEGLADLMAEAIEMATMPLHARICELEKRPTLTWGGTFAAGKSYDAGAVVIRHRSAFVAKVDGAAADPANPGGEAQWTLLAPGRGATR